MIKYEYGMLVLDNTASKSDAKAIDSFIQDAKFQERERILMAIDELEQQSHATKTPIYQDTLFKRVCEIVLDLA
jgi:hypothetical protein